MVPKKEYHFTLPCQIGDEVWIWSPWRAEFIKGKVSMLQQKANKEWKIRISCGSSVFDRPISEIGKWIFFSKEDAKQRREEWDSMG